MAVAPSPGSLSAVLEASVRIVRSSVVLWWISHWIIHWWRCSSRAGVRGSVLRKVVWRSSYMRVVLVSWGPGRGGHCHMMARISTRIGSSRSHNGHKLLIPPYIPHVSLLALMFVVSELNNEGSGRTLHHEVVMENLNGLYR